MKAESIGVIQNNLVLELHVPSFQPVRDFYSQFGFEEVNYDPTSGGGSDLGYLVMRRRDEIGDTTLNFYGDKEKVTKHAYFVDFPVDTPKGYGVEITIPVKDVQALWQNVGNKLASKTISQPLMMKRWGKQDFRVVDPFGFYVRFTELVDWGQSDKAPSMKLYRFSPIQNKDELMEAIKYVHVACNKLCKQSFGEYLPNAGNLGIFCHYDNEYDHLITLRREMTEASDNLNQKYFRLHEPITIPAEDDIPETTYTHLYIRKPDPYRHHVGDVDFYLEPDEYKELKQAMQNGKVVKGARIFPRQDLDMIELYDPDVDACGYVSTHQMATSAHVKQSEETNL